MENIWLQQAGYTSGSLKDNISTALAVILSLAVILIAVGTFIDRALVKKGQKCNLMRYFFKGMMTLAAFIYAFCYLELVLC